MGLSARKSSKVQSTTQVGHQRHLAASFLSRLYAGVANLLSVPIFLHWLGAEAFGLIGLSATMQALFYILDAGFGGAVTRELARARGDDEVFQAAISRCRALEKFYWALMPLIVLSAFLAGAVFVLHWNGSGGIPRREMFLVIGLMSMTIGFQWLQGFFTAALYGVYQHVSVAVIQAVVWTARTAGTLLVLVVAGTNVTTFFVCQLLIAMTAVIVLRFVVTRYAYSRVPGTTSETIATALRGVRSIAAMVAGASAALLVFNQTDKMIVGLGFDLETFGYYSLVWQISGALYLIYNPIYNMYLPLTASALASGDRESLLGHARDGAILLALLVIPLATVIAIYSPEVLLLWTGSAETAERAGPFLRLTFIGASFHALFFGSYVVQMAGGRLAITLRVVIGVLILLVPSMLLVTWLGFSATSVVAIWVAASGLFLLGSTLLTASSVLSVQPRQWLWNTVALPMAVAVAVASALSYWELEWLRSLSGVGLILYLAMAWLALTLLLLAASRDCRRVVADAIRALAAPLKGAIR